MIHNISPESIPLGLTFDDVLLLPQYSTIKSRQEVDLSSKFSKNIPLKIPIVSSPMDTVTEQQMAKEMAFWGGIGIIHRQMPINEQATMIKQIKTAQAYTIDYPLTVPMNMKVKILKELVQIHNIKTFLVTKECEIPFEIIKRNINKPKLEGIVTNRDLLARKDENQTVKEIMTPRNKMVVFEVKIDKEGGHGQMPSVEQVKRLMLDNKVQKLPFVTDQNDIVALTTLRDIVTMFENQYANIDSKGQLLVGGAIGAKDDYIERAKCLVEAGCDVLVLDIANGHSQVCIDGVKEIKALFPKIDLVAGSIATGEGAEMLIKAGADGIRCGIGSGSICTTRIVSGCGVPQLTALLDVVPICRKYGIPLISDGGIRQSGHIALALASGANSVMLGRLLAGSEESPTEPFYKEGKFVKIYRGMAGIGANVSKAEKIGLKDIKPSKFTPEGVEGYIPQAGPLKEILNQFITGIRSGMSYVGAKNIEELQKKAKFIRITQSGYIESQVHDIYKF